MTAPTLAEHFHFETKAQNLAQLFGRLATATVCELEIVTIGPWRQDPESTLDRLQSRFPDQRIIFRSSAFGEDSVESSQAGAFESVGDVDSTDRNAMRNAMNAVIESYNPGAVDPASFDDYEVLVQPMLRNVAVSGVLFTRGLVRRTPLTTFSTTTTRRARPTP